MNPVRVIIAVAALAAGQWVCAADWPQFQCNAARTGWTSDSPAPPYESAYVLDFTPEVLGSVQPIVYKSVMYIPTLHGRLYAINPVNGQRLWVREGVGTVAKTAAAADDLVYTANLEGELCASRAADGEPVWRRDLSFGISATPCLYEGRIYIGNRRGEFFCIDGRSGQVIWQRKLDHYIWSSAAAANGRVYICTDGEIHLYCLDAGTGQVLWRSEKLPGMFMRDWCPVVTGGKVFVRTMPVVSPSEDLPKPYALWERNPEPFRRYYEQLRAGGLPDDFKQANAKLIEWFTAEPYRQTMFAFDAESGKRPYVVGAFHYLAGWGMTSSPPAVDADGMLQVVVPFPWCRFGRLDPATGQICQIMVGELLQEQRAEGWLDGFNGNSDEGHASSAGGTRVFWCHFSGPNYNRGFGQSVSFDWATRQETFLRRSGGARGQPIRISVSDLKPRRIIDYTYLSDNSIGEAFTAAAIWQDLIIHHAASGASGTHGRIVVLRGRGGAQ